MAHHYTPDQVDFIKGHLDGIGNYELTEIINAYFGLSLAVSQIKSFKANHHLSSGLDGRFRPGSTPFNKGKKGIGGWEPTQFKEGNKPWNYKPVGPVTIMLSPKTYQSTIRIPNTVNSRVPCLLPNGLMV